MTVREIGMEDDRVTWRLDEKEIWRMDEGWMKILKGFYPSALHY